MDDPDIQRRSRAMSLMRRARILIRVASQLERAKPWAYRTPEI
jgi:hypothetical protein